MDSIDLYAPQFWWFVGAALLLLVPQTNASARKWTFAALNLFFLALHVTPGQAQAFPSIVAGLVLAWGMLRWAARPGSGRWPVLIGGLGVLLLFSLHKLPHVGTRLGASQAESILAAIGFSYVSLRLIDVSRAVKDGRHGPPDLPSTINYLLPFHMIAAGPIQSYDDFVGQPGVPPPLNASRSLMALERIALGLCKKFILANYIDRVFLDRFSGADALFPLRSATELPLALPRLQRL